MEQTPWQHYFEISDQQLQDWQSQCPSDQDLLVWLLSEGFINEQKYLAWAKDYYQIPLFKDHLPELFNLPTPAYNAPALSHSVPFTQWEDVTYYACLAPPPEMVDFPSCVAILTPLEIFQHLAGHAKTINSASAAEVLSGIDLNIAPSDTLDFHSLSLTTKNQGPSQKEPIAPPAPISEFKPPLSQTVNSSSNNPTPSHTQSVQATQDPLFVPFYQYFDRCMILLFEKDHVKPWKWDSKWQEPNLIFSQIELNSASIFKIVFKTMQPYHGYMAASPVNNSFVQAWNNSQLFDHVTLYPLLVNEQWVGMFLGVTTKDKANQFKLTDLQPHIQKLTLSLTSAPLAKAS